MIGSVWVAVAKLYNDNYKLIGTCTDTPNAIGSALRELPEAKIINGLMGITNREQYEHRIETWNKCPSGLIKR
jgi:hypothetical protein